MTIPMRLIVAAWLVQAVSSSIPWLVTAGPHIWAWAQNPVMVPIITLHSAGTLLPIMAAVSLWRRRELLACLALTVAAIVPLAWHILSFTQLAWVVRDLGRIALSVVTLIIVIVYAVGRIREPSVREPA
jgi:cytochrome oxidase assembly protein ShyY1